MHIVFYAFVGAWILGAVLSGKVWRYGKNWRPICRVITTTTVAAVFFSPSAVVAHGILPFPLLGALIWQPKAIVEMFLSEPKFTLALTLIPLVLTWLFCLMVFSARRSNEEHKNTA